MNSPEKEQTTHDVEELDDGSFFVAASAAVRRLRAQVDQVAPINIPVLCVGESGTGKEVIARLIHRHSCRSHHPFLKVNCAAMPGELLESEMFGFERGAFTGAVRSKPGKFELCNRGTILLDEIGEMPPPLQAKLLHVLQDQEFTRLGGSSRVKVDVRILSATNVNIKQAIAAKAFREDLYYRLSTFVFYVPPLRERREDIPLLLDRYMALYAERYSLTRRPLSAALVESCLHYEWPGNIRELENFAKRYLVVGDHALAFSSSPHVPDSLTSLVAPPRPAEGHACEDLKLRVRNLKDEAETAAIRTALQQTNWNRKHAARVLNISYKSLLCKIDRFGIGHRSSMDSTEIADTPDPSRSTSSTP